MNRAAATTYLTTEYSDLITDAGFTTGATTDALNVAIDNSLRKLGFDESALPTADVAQASIQSYLALLNFYILKRFARLLAIRFDVAVGQSSVDAKRSQAFAAVEHLLAEAEGELAALGIVIGGMSALYELGRVQLDFIEPTLSMGG